jgi:hypothetical protein
MDKPKRYETAVYLILILLAIILGFTGNWLTVEPIKSITLSLVSELLGFAILFFIVNRFFRLDEDRETSNQILAEITEIKRSLQNRLELEQKRQDQKIKVILNYGGSEMELPVALRRAEFSRAEILGRIGMMPMKEVGKRFSLGYLNSSKFLDQVNQILTGEQDASLTIPCTESEFIQFALTEEK